MKPLHKIVELVDRDVAGSGKPLSLVGIIVPFLPFMLFVKGAPLDSHPVLGSLALATSIGWGVFVIWRLLRHSGVELEGYGYKIGSARFWRLTLATLTLIALAAAALMWLDNGLV
jgi:hypothetical protein